MSTLGSWIDPEEISDLVPSLLTGKPENEAAEPDSATAEDAGETEAESGTFAADNPPQPDGETAGVSAVVAEEFSDSEENSRTAETELPASGGSDNEPESESGDAEEPAEPGIPKAEIETETVTDPDLASETDLNFDTPEAYGAGAFPAEEEKSAVNIAPARRAAAVQAAVTLEKARTRANLGGLLKTSQSSQSPEEAETDNQEENIDPTDSPSEPPTLKNRLAEFAKAAAELTGGSEPEIADLQRYPLHIPANGKSDPLGARDPAFRMTDLINRLSSELDAARFGDGETGIAQIALKNGDWLCVLSEKSAAGGVCLTMRVPEPVSNRTAGKLRKDLRRALGQDAD